MKKSIKNNELIIVNFKGIKNLSIPFGQITNIFGDNGTGKTTVADAFTWLFFGKNTEGKTDFDIKPLDANNKTNPKTNHF